MHARKTVLKTASISPYTAMAMGVLIVGSLGGVGVGVVAGVAAYWIASRNE